MSQKVEIKKTLDQINTKVESIYYCANIIENTFPCSTKLFYNKKGSFGCNYRYCSSCYKKWDNLKEEKKFQQSCDTFLD